MRLVPTPIQERFARPRLASLGLAGILLAGVGGLLWLASPGAGLRGTGFRLLILGYVLALAGATGYLSFAAFDYRDRQLR